MFNFDKKEDSEAKPPIKERIARFKANSRDPMWRRKFMKYTSIPMLIILARMEADPYDGKYKFFCLSRYYERELGKYFMEKYDREEK